MQNDMPMMIERSKSKSKLESQYGGGFFPEPEAVISQPRFDIFRRNLVCKCRLRAYTQRLDERTKPWDL